MTALDDRPAVNEAEQRLTRDLAVHAVFGKLITAMPSDIRIAAWRIREGRINGQQQVWPRNDEQARANLCSLAALFDLVYGESPASDRTRMFASGLIDGIAVEFWEYTTPVCRCIGVCDHGVVSL